MSAPPALRLPSIDGLRAFETSAREGTFERAAEELAITASAVGKRVATLEELLGAPLFTRTGKSLALTPAGREYLERVRPALDLLASLPQHRRDAQRRDRLRLVAPPTFARQILVPHLDEFARIEPELELEVVLSIPFADAQPADADVEVRLDAVGEAEAVLMHDVVLPLAAPALLRRGPPLQRPADLAQHPLLRTPIEPWTPWWRAAGLDWPEPTQGPRLVDLGLTLDAAVQGQGIALGRPSLARRWIEAGNLVAPFALSVRPASQYRLAAVAPTPAAQRFRQWLQHCCTRWAAASRALLSGPA